MGRIVDSRHAEDPLAPSEHELARSQSWAAQLFRGPESLPISFRYGSDRLVGIPSGWDPTTQRHRAGSAVTVTSIEGHAGDSGLHVRAEATVYLDYPVVEWVAWLRNDGAGPTPLLEHIAAIDTTFAGDAPTLMHWNGDFNSELGYAPQVSRLKAGDRLRQAPVGGRPCDGAFPYFRLLFEDGGLALALGWPGQWSAEFEGTAEGVAVRAGQETTRLQLQPGEAIRTPRVTVLSWLGDEDRGVNLWRRWYRAHVLPRSVRGPMRPLLSAATTDEGEEFTGATEDNQVRYLRRFGERGLDPDVWWIDAGWYPCSTSEGHRSWRMTGSWEPDPERFPRGLTPVSRAAAETGADLLLWFEPERVAPGTRLAREHPEWLLRAQTGSPQTSTQATSALLNLGDPACGAWLASHLTREIQRNGIRVYRQDFNFRPLPFWEANDATDRQGVTENLHVQGYLRLWDELLERNPGLWIDSCASGGRRNDLETMRRSVPLHYTDYGYGYHRVKLAFHRTLFEWLPYFKETNVSWSESPTEPGALQTEPPDSFAFHCALAPMLSLALDIRETDADLALFRRMSEIWRRAAPMILDADYYPLTPFSKSAEEWVAWQFDLPARGEGFVQAIRHREAQREELTLHLRGLDPTARYLLDDPETGEHRELSGSALREGSLRVALPPRAGRLWFYRAGAPSR